MRINLWSYAKYRDFGLVTAWYFWIKTLWHSNRLFIIRVERPDQLILFILYLLSLTGGFFL